MQNKKSILNISYTALFSAIFVLATGIKFSTGMGEGYIHLGDAVIYISACILPFPYCLIPGALGGALADVLSGFAVWALPTAIIKVLTALPFALASRKESKILNKKTAFMPIVSGAVTVGGYFTAESILYSTASATVSLIGNFIQATVCGVLFYIIAAALDKMNFKRRINNG